MNCDVLTTPRCTQVLKLVGTALGAYIMGDEVENGERGARVAAQSFPHKPTIRHFANTPFLINAEARQYLIPAQINLRAIDRALHQQHVMCEYINIRIEDGVLFMPGRVVTHAVDGSTM